MTIRVFRARINPGKEDEFERFVPDTGVPMVEAQAGCSQVTWGRSRWSDQPEFVVVTHWDSVAALEAFAGPRWQEAVIEPDEEHLLAEYQAQRARYRDLVACLDLDTPSQRPVSGRPVTLRWILFHLVEDTARHNGHLDILRELADGVTST